MAFKKVDLSDGNITMSAAYATAPGSAMVRTAAGKAGAVKLTTETNVLGIVIDDPVQMTPNEGFYPANHPLSIKVEGKVRVNVIPNGADVNIEAGDYLEVADVGSTNTGRHGLLEEAGSKAGATKTATSIARALEDVTMGDEGYDVVSAVAVGDETVTFSSAAKLTAMDLSIGDYVLLEDLDGNVQLNRVKSIDSTTVIGLQIPATVALNGSTDLLTKVYQVAAVLI